MSTFTPSLPMERVSLKSDNGSTLEFSGYIFSETSYYEDETRTLTRLRLYLDDTGCQVYSIIANDGETTSRRHYRVRPLAEVCEMSDGVNTLTLPSDMLFAAVFGLCGIDPARAGSLRPAFEESLRCINAE